MVEHRFVEPITVVRFHYAVPVRRYRLDLIGRHPLKVVARV